jgi:hypothetical protein
MLRAGGVVGVDPAQSGRGRQLSVIGAANADIDADAPAAQPQRVDRGVLQRLPGAFQQQPLLRIETGGLTRADAPERRVEPIHRTEPATSQRPDGAGSGAGGVVQVGEGRVVDAPSFGGEVRGQVRAGRQRGPEANRVDDPAGEAQAYPENADGGAPIGLRRVEPRPQCADR